MPKFKKGSAEAKAFMAKLRASRGTSKVGKAKAKAKTKSKPKRKNLFVKKLAVYARPTKSGKIRPYVRKVGSLSTYNKAPLAVRKLIDSLDNISNYSDRNKIVKSIEAKGYMIEFAMDGSIERLKKLPGKKVGARKLSEKQLIKIASDYAYVTSSDLDKVTWRLLDPDYTNVLLPKYKAAIKAFETEYKTKVTPKIKKVGAAKKTTTSKHKDTKSHNVNIRVMSGYNIPKERIFISGTLMHKKKISGIGKTNDKINYNVPPIKVLIQKRDITNLPKITSSSVAAAICRESINKTGLIQTQEVFGVLIMNHQNTVLGVYNHTIGAQNSTQIDVTLVAAMIAKLAPKAAIIFHNHPSGALKPSDADLIMTKQLKEACKILGCQLLDSLIITNTGYYSLADEGQF